MAPNAWKVAGLTADDLPCSYLRSSDSDRDVAQVLTAYEGLET